MSGGRFNYADCNLKSEMFGWVDEPYNVMEDDEISELVWDVLNLIHDLDYNCGGRIGHLDTYCNNCGQRIEWD